MLKNKHFRRIVAIDRVDDALTRRIQRVVAPQRDLRCSTTTLYLRFALIQIYSGIYSKQTGNSSPRLARAHSLMIIEKR